MADEISNKTLAVLVVAAIVVTLGGTMLVLREGPSVSLTGFATSQEGTAAFNVEEVVSILIVDSAIDFGTGYVNDAIAYSCTMDSMGNANTSCANSWASPTDAGFVIQNDGNVDASVTITGTAAASFIGGTGPSYKFQSTSQSGTQGESSSCSNGTVSTWTEITGSAQSVCNTFNYEDSTDRMVIDLQVKVPSDAQPGVHSDTLTFTAAKA